MNSSKRLTFLLVVVGSGLSCTGAQLPGCGTGEVCAPGFTCDESKGVCRKSETVTLDIAFEGEGVVRWSTNETNALCGSRCQVELGVGASVTLTPDPKFVFHGWGGACAGTGPCTVTLDQAKTVVGRFQGQPFTLRVQMIGSGFASQASVTSNLGPLRCDLNDCFASPLPGTVVTLHATPWPGGVFAGWGSPCSGTTDCTVVMTTDQDISAVFTRPVEPVELMVSIVGPGWVWYYAPYSLSNMPKTGITTLLSWGAEFIFQPEPDPGARFVGWSGACSGSESCSGTAVGPVSVTATFEKL